MRAPTAAPVLAAAIAACSTGHRPIDVQIAFRNTWTLGGAALSASEQARIRRTAIATVRSAFRDFDVQIVDAPARYRVVIEDTPYGSPMYLGSVGMTLATSTTSSIRFDSLYYTELDVLGCESMTNCAAKTRDEIVTGLGVGIGATAAHELGHQRGLEFTRHSPCDDCYDGARATSYAHFFGEKHWSADALTRMNAVIGTARLTPRASSQ